MGPGRYRPTFWEAVVVQSLCFVLAIFLPIVWVVLILFGLVNILLSPSKAISKAKDTAQLIGIVTLVPILFTLEHCRLLCGGNNDDKYVRADLK
jgi:hypothetical protein